MIYFAYGSNLHKRQMQRRCPGSKPVCKTVLHNHRMIYRRGVATIEPSPGSMVKGAIYVITDKDLEPLDRYEGYPNLYYRQNFHVEVGPNKFVEAMAYVMHSHFKRQEPSEGYRQTIQQGYVDWGWENAQA